MQYQYTTQDKKEFECPFMTILILID